MTQVTGVGGVFLRVADPDKLYAWYEEHLGIKRTEGGFVFFSEGPQEMTILAFFPLDTKYFGPSEQRSMLNFRVDDLDALLDKLHAAGVDIDPRRDEADFGRFALVQRSGRKPGGTLGDAQNAARLTKNRRRIRQDTPPVCVAISRARGQLR
jgi:catechol 2,3-dioxygenase-like lactoylglutathione lyase family enzyme